MSDTVIVYVAAEILPKKGLKAHHLEPVWKKYEPDGSHVEYLTLADISETVSGTQLSYEVSRKAVRRTCLPL